MEVYLKVGDRVRTPHGVGACVAKEDGLLLVQHDEANSEIFHSGPRCEYPESTCYWYGPKELTIIKPPQFAQPQPATIEPPIEGCMDDNIDGPDFTFEEVHGLLPSSSTERKGIPITTGVLDYFPAAIAYVAKVSKFGNDKHNPGESMHWARGKSMDQADCIGRHLLERGTSDADGIKHSGYLAWRALALLQEELEAEGAPLARGAR